MPETSRIKISYVDEPVKKNPVEPDLALRVGMGDNKGRGESSGTEFELRRKRVRRRDRVDSHESKRSEAQNS